MMDLKKYDEILGQPIEMGSVIAVGRDEMLDIITRLRQAEKDAARWNYVINNHCIGDMNMGIYADYNYGMDVVTKDDAIAIVDEAMQCNK